MSLWGQMLWCTGMTWQPGIGLVERVKTIEEGGVDCFKQYDSEVEVESLKVDD